MPAAGEKMKMKKMIYLVAGLFVWVGITAMAPGEEQLLYLASQQDKTITVSTVNPETGALTEKHKLDLPGTPGPLAFSPDKKLVYAAMTSVGDVPAAVATLRREKDGSLSLLKTATIRTRAPYIRADRSGKFLLAAHYGAGEVTMYRITDGLVTDEMLDHHVTEKTAHCIEVDRSGQFVFVPHTGPNKVYQFRLDPKAGKLVPNDPPFVLGPDTENRYHEPRHIAMHPEFNMAFTSNENGGGITSWKLDPESGRLTRLETLSTLPPGYEESSHAADIKITPNGRFAYVSNRDTTERAEGEKMRDTITAVWISLRTGKMKVVGHYATAHFPRSFCIDVTGEFLYAAGQKTTELVAYRINRRSGALEQLKTYQVGGGPIWVMTANQ